MANAFLGAGMMLQAWGTMESMSSQAAAEEKNASFYREQAKFSKKAGKRQVKIFNQETDVLFGEQAAAFAKAGGGSFSSVNFIAATKVQRQAEANAIKDEADMNERLALLRAEGAQGRADELNDPFNKFMAVGGGFFGGAKSLI